MSSLARLEDELRLPPALSCDAAAPFLSSVRDGEADSFDGDIASRHLAVCAGCRLATSTWTTLEASLVGTLAFPSARIDRAMAHLVRPERAPRRHGPTALGPLGGIAWRGAVLAILAFAIAFGSTLAPQPDDALRTTGPVENTLVGAVQQVVLHAATNTLYVARPDDGAVNALDATTYAVRARIPVGGRPTALALNDPANRLIVLDGVAKRLTEIDIARNAVVETTQLQLNGTPTSVQVDNGKIAVFTTVAPKPPKPPTASAAAPEPKGEAPAATGQVAVFDPGTKALETIRNVDLAPRLVVPDPTGSRTLLVSPEATTIADASYRTMATVGGGVGAAFGQGDRIAVLSTGKDGARLTFYGEAAPAPVRLDGQPTAVIGLPDGSFAVLLDIGGRGRIVVLDGSGAAAGQVDLAVPGRGLAYDDGAKKFSVIGGGEVAAASLPVVAAQAPRSADASATPRAADASAAPRTADSSATPRASATPARSPTPAPSPTETASPVVSPTVTPQPSASPSAAPSASAPTPVVAGVPAGAIRVAPDLYRLPLGDSRVPVLVAPSESRVWFVDQRNQLAALDTSTGAIFTVAPLPRDAILRGLAAGRTHLYAVDIAKGRLFELAIDSEKLTQHPLGAADVTAMTVAPDGTLWIAMRDSSNLLAFHPGTKHFQLVDVGVRGAVTLAAERGGRLWFSNGGTGIGSYDIGSGRLTLRAWPAPNAPSVLAADPLGQVWAGTATGDVYSLRDGAAGLVTRVGRPITALAFDPNGQAWYLAPALGAAGFAYAPVDGSRPARLVPGPAASLAFNWAWRSWLADPAGGFYLGTEAAR
ncbi:MAG: hypothetical protein H0V71_05125 [Chloroflexi bacterium]|nr:hypothetical protein [Chloroflexota bacterium]